MILDDLAEFSVRNFLGSANIREFLVENNLYSDWVIYAMLSVHYFNNTKDSCYFADIEAISRPGIRIALKISFHNMVKSRHLDVVEKDENLGNKYEVTNKGRAILDRYMIFLKEEERKRFYIIKKNHRDAQEGDKKF